MDKTYLIGICALTFLIGLIAYSSYMIWVVQPEFEPYIKCSDGSKEKLNLSNIYLCGKINPYYGMTIDEVKEMKYGG